MCIVFLYCTAATDELDKMLKAHEPDTEMSSLIQVQYPAEQDYHATYEATVFTFKVEAEVEEMLRPFSIMSDENKPSIFMELWEKSKQKYLLECEQEKSTPSLTLPQVTTRIWKPVYNECKQILQELSSLTMPLKKLKEYPFPEEKEELEQHLRNLCQVVDSCMSIEGKEPTGEEWVRGTVNRMLKYRTLCKYANAAETLLKLKETLNLSGDFSLVETLSQQVGMIKYNSNDLSFCFGMCCRFPRMLKKK